MKLLIPVSPAIPREVEMRTRYSLDAPVVSREAPVTPRLGCIKPPASVHPDFRIKLSIVNKFDA